jgi:hypothetical protein
MYIIYAVEKASLCNLGPKSFKMSIIKILPVSVTAFKCYHYLEITEIIPILFMGSGCDNVDPQSEVWQHHSHLSTWTKEYG